VIFIGIGVLGYVLRDQLSSDLFENKNNVDPVLVIDRVLVGGFVIFILTGIVAAGWFVSEFWFHEEGAGQFQTRKALLPLILLSSASVFATSCILGVKPILEPVTLVLKKGTEVLEAVESKEGTEGQKELSNIPPEDVQQEEDALKLECEALPPDEKDGLSFPERAQTALLSHAEGAWNIINVVPECRRGEDGHVEITSRKTVLAIPNDQVVEVRTNL
jgi:hypothetical protein